MIPQHRWFLLFVAAWMATAPRPGTARADDVQVNTYIWGFQERPAVALDADGDFVVVWESLGSAGTDSWDFSIQGRRFGADGSSAGGQFQVNTYTTGDQVRPAVAMDAGGGFVVVWQSTVGGIDIQAQRFAADGSPRGGQFRVNTFTGGFNTWPAVEVDADGDCVVIWESSVSAGPDPDFSIQGRRFAADGSPTGGQFQVNTSTTNSQRRPAAAMDADGDFVVVWDSFGSAGTDSDASIQGQRFAADGSPAGFQFQINSYIRSSQWVAAVAMDADGDFVVTWESRGSFGTDRSATSIQGQRYAADGSATGGQFQVNTATASYQVNSSVAMDGDGDFVVAWVSVTSYTGYVEDLDIRSQRFAADGSRLRGELQVNTYTTSEQNYPSVALAGDGDLIVVWDSWGSGGTDHSITSIQRTPLDLLFADGFESGDAGAWSS